MPQNIAVNSAHGKKTVQPHHGMSSVDGTSAFNLLAQITDKHTHRTRISFIPVILGWIPLRLFPAL